MKPTPDPLFHRTEENCTHARDGSFAKGCLIALGIEVVVIVAVLGYCWHKGLL